MSARGSWFRPVLDARTDVIVCVCILADSFILPHHVPLSSQLSRAVTSRSPSICRSYLDHPVKIQQVAHKSTCSQGHSGLIMLKTCRATRRVKSESDLKANSQLCLPLITFRFWFLLSHRLCLFSPMAHGKVLEARRKATLLAYLPSQSRELILRLKSPPQRPLAWQPSQAQPSLKVFQAR